MKRWQTFVGVILAGLVVASCRTQDIRTVTIRIPEMKNQACSEIITEAVARQQGVLREKIVVDLAGRSVRVTYDSMQLAIKNIEHAIADAGFQANGIPADEKARQALPAECR